VWVKPAADLLAPIASRSQQQRRTKRG
jgi:hypothetical protein